jgi:hypothetical protein
VRGRTQRRICSSASKEKPALDQIQPDAGVVGAHGHVDPGKDFRAVTP